MYTLPPPPPTAQMPSPRFARNPDARQQYEDGNLNAQNEPREKTEGTSNAIGTPGRNSVHQITDADTLNAPLIDHVLCLGGSGSPPQSTDLFMPGTFQITIDSISIPDIVRVLPRNVLKRIPKGARYQVAKAFTGLLNDCLQKNFTPSWTRLFAFPRLVLCTSDDSGDF
ncbi:hypothetical protein ACOME3_003170 [Neoechinorhynchus agilis]